MRLTKRKKKKKIETKRGGGFIETKSPPCFSPLQYVSFRFLHSLLTEKIKKENVVKPRREKTEKKGKNWTVKEVKNRGVNPELVPSYWPIIGSRLQNQVLPRVKPVIRTGYSVSETPGMNLTGMIKT
jgi:hypothetical protein